MQSVFWSHCRSHVSIISNWCKVRVFCCWSQGPQFIVSSKELLWGIESAQNFDPREIAHCQHAKSNMIWSPIHVIHVRLQWIMETQTYPACTIATKKSAWWLWSLNGKLISFSQLSVWLSMLHHVILGHLNTWVLGLSCVHGESRIDRFFCISIPVIHFMLQHQSSIQDKWIHNFRITTITLPLNPNQQAKNTQNKTKIKTKQNWVQNWNKNGINMELKATATTIKNRQCCSFRASHWPESFWACRIMSQKIVPDYMLHMNISLNLKIFE